MAKLNITTKVAIQEIRKLMIEVDNLRQKVSTSGKANADSFNMITNSLRELKNNAHITASVINNMTSAIAKQQVEIEKLNSALAKKTATTKRLNDEYAQLNKSIKEAERNVRNLTIKHGENSTQVASARAEYDKLKETLQNVNSTTKAVKQSTQESLDAYAQLKKELKDATTNARNLAVEFGVNSKEAKSASDRVKELQKRLDEVNKSLKETKAGAGKTSSAFAMVGSGALALAGAFGLIASIQLFADITKQTFALVKQFDSINFALEKITGNMFDTAVSQRFLLDITDRFGAELVTTANRWIKFMAAAQHSGVTLKDTEDIFRSMTKAAGVLGLKTDELSGIYLALEQMFSKGKVTTEELRRQLGERLPGAMGIMAASMGVTIVELDKMLKKGQVLSADVLPGFGKAVEIAFGVETLEKVDTLTAANIRLGNSWQRFILLISDNTGVLKRAMSWLADTVNKISFSMASDKEKVNILTINEKLIFEQKFLDKTRIIHDKTIEEAKRFASIEVRIHKNKLSLKNAVDDGDIASQKKYKLIQDKLMKEKVDYGMEVFDLQQNIARKQLKLENEKLKSLEHAFGLMSISDKKGLVRNAEGMIVTKLENSMAELSKQIAIVEVYRKYAEEKPDPLIPENTEEGDGSGGRRRKLNTVDTTAIDLAIAKLKYLKSIEDEITENQNLSEAARLIALRKSIEMEMEILKLEKDKKLLLAGETEMQIAQLKGYIAEETNDKTKKTLEEQLKHLEIENERTANELLIIEADYQTAYHQLLRAGGDKSLALLRKIIDERKALKQEELEEVDMIYNTLQTEELLKLYKQGLIDLEDFETKKDEIIHRHAIARLDELIRIAKLDPALKKPETKDGMLALEALKKLELSKAEIVKTNGDKILRTKQEQFAEDIEMAQEFAGELVGILNSIHEARIQAIEREKDNVKESYELEKLLADDNKVQNDIRERQHQAELKVLDDKIRKEKVKQAKLNKVASLVDIAMNTAVAYTAALKLGPILGIPAATLMLVLGGLQAAAVIAQPIPKFKDGGSMGRDGLAIVGDGGQREVVQTSKGTYLTGDKPQLIGLQKGDKVYKNIADYQSKTMSDLQRASVLTSLESDRKGLQGADILKSFNRNFDNLENKIIGAMQKATIKNTNNIKIDLEHLLYRTKTL